MTTKQAIDILREYKRQYRGDVRVGSELRLRRDHQLHVVTRIEEYDYRQPYQVDNKEWVGRNDIEWPHPSLVSEALDVAVNHMLKYGKQSN